MTTPKSPVASFLSFFSLTHRSFSLAAHSSNTTPFGTHPTNTTHTRCHMPPRSVMLSAAIFQHLCRYLHPGREGGGESKAQRFDTDHINCGKPLAVAPNDGLRAHFFPAIHHTQCHNYLQIAHGAPSRTGGITARGQSPTSRSAPTTAHLEWHHRLAP